MELYAIGAVSAIIALVAIAAWVFVRIEQHKIQYHNPEEIAELRAELERQAAIVNRLDADGLEYVKERADMIAGQLRDLQLNQALRR